MNLTCRLFGLTLMSIFGCTAAVAPAQQSQTPAASATNSTDASIVDVRKVWDKAPHNAFTDLTFFKGQWYLTFREGSKHVSSDGVVRVLRSTDFETWESVAEFSSADQDLRECHFSIGPDQTLYLSGAAHNLGRMPNHWSYVWSSTDGTNWSDRTQVIDPAMWLWRMTWHDGKAYGFAYSTAPEQFLSLYTSDDGKRWDTLVPRLLDGNFPNETAPLFLKDGTLLAVVRRDGKPPTAQFGIAKPPYTKWQWKDLGVRIGSPTLLELPDGRVLAPLRLLAPMRTALCWLDAERGTLTEFLTLPSGGDGGYPGAVYRDGTLYLSYYSSHEDKKSSIYVARIKINEQPTVKAN